jgi:hypothetical protein
MAGTNDANFSFGNLASADGAILQFDTRILITLGENQNVSFFLGDPNLNVYSSPQIQRVEHDVPSKRRGKQYQR